jgi:redox-sensitive bicupin YhaK (pirin superfamily)
MASTRKVKWMSHGRPTMEGAGVRLKRAFGYNEVPMFDPFLMLDDFSSNKPSDYLAGFPWHPHRGIETITYMLHGKVEHGDSMGNAGTIHSGDVQWMTAGSGIIHQEMPRKPKDSTIIAGFQLWANLPAKHKMMDPRYRDVHSSTIPEVKISGVARVKVICGVVEGVYGPVKDIVIDPEYIDVTIEPGATFTREVKDGHMACAYMIDGEAVFDEDKPAAGKETLVLLGEGNMIVSKASGTGARFLFISGKPIREPVAWGGPIVMNTEDELRTAFEEYEAGTFVKHGKPGKKR